MPEQKLHDCPTCICGRRAPVQGDRLHQLPASHPERPAGARGPGTISWTEHEEAWAAYAAKYGRSQSAERIAQRGGFGFGELRELLGREPSTWAPAGAVAERERTVG
jgi:hypothetical protein